MEAIRQIIDSNLLNGIIQLPSEFHNKRVEVVVSVKEERRLPKVTRAELDEMVKKSRMKKYAGIISDDGMTLEDYRAERMKKHECLD